MLLTREQIQILTGYKQPSAQIRALRKMGVRHIVNARGRPIVDDSVFGGDAVSHSKPNFDAR